MSIPLNEIASQAQQRVLDSIPSKWILPDHLKGASSVIDVPKSCGLLSPKQIEITEQTATALLEKLSARKLSSAEVTEAFCARAAIAHQLVRMITKAGSILDLFIHTHNLLDKLFDFLFL